MSSDHTVGFFGIFYPMVEPPQPNEKCYIGTVISPHSPPKSVFNEGSKDWYFQFSEICEWISENIETIENPEETFFITSRPLFLDPELTYNRVRYINPE